jgi:thioredoxin reductase (NADPH)
VDGNGQERLNAYGLLVRIGMKPSTDMLEDVVDLDPDGYVVANDQLETSAQYVLACGDIRTGSGRSVAAAVKDGEKAAARAAELLKALEK